MPYIYWKTRLSKKYTLGLTLNTCQQFFFVKILIYHNTSLKTFVTNKITPALLLINLCKSMLACLKIKTKCMELFHLSHQQNQTLAFVLVAKLKIVSPIFTRIVSRTLLMTLLAGLSRLELCCDNTLWRIFTLEVPAATASVRITHLTVTKQKKFAFAEQDEIASLGRKKEENFRWLWCMATGGGWAFPSWLSRWQPADDKCLSACYESCVLSDPELHRLPCSREMVNQVTAHTASCDGMNEFSERATSGKWNWNFISVATNLAVGICLTRELCHRHAQSKTNIEHGELCERVKASCHVRWNLPRRNWPHLYVSECHNEAEQHDNPLNPCCNWK